MFMRGCLFPESVLGCVTFSVTHQPAFRVPAGSELLITARQLSEPRLCFTGVGSWCFASITRCPALCYWQTTLYYSHPELLCRLQRLSFWSLRRGTEAMRGPVGIDMQEWGAGPWLPGLELEFGEAQGAGWTRECTAGPQKVTRDPPFMDGETEAYGLDVLTMSFIFCVLMLRPC